MDHTWPSDAASLFHLYSRAQAGMRLFRDAEDFERFMHLLYAVNTARPFSARNLDQGKPFSLPRPDTLVEIRAYCLMPGHVHAVFRERLPHGGRRFVRKVICAYARYHKGKYGQPGTVFKELRMPRRIDGEDAERRLIQYIHLNPFHRDENNLPNSVRMRPSEAIEISSSYPYSSMPDYLGVRRPANAILGRD